MDRMNIFGNTSLGRVRTNNEDTYICQTIWDDDHILAAAIDGVGGYEGGEVAAEMARKGIIEYLDTYRNGEPQILLREAVVYANNNIFNARKEVPVYAHMSCVLTAVLVDVKNRSIHMAHVGDTRLYEYANGEIHKLSHDHSLVGYREEIGELTEEEAMRHPQRNIIGRDVGSTFLESSGNDRVETASFLLQPQSTLLLCSDGLCDMITSKQMAEVLARNLSVKDKVDALIAAANDAGGRDNVTVVLVEADFEEEKQGYTIAGTPQQTEVKEVYMSDTPSSKPSSPKKFDRKLLLLIPVVLVLLGVGFLLGSFFGGSAPGNVEKSTDDKPQVVVKKDTMARDTSLVIMNLKKEVVKRDSVIAKKDSVITANEEYADSLRKVIVGLEKDTFGLNRQLKAKDEELKNLRTTANNP